MYLVPTLATNISRLRLTTRSMIRRPMETQLIFRETLVAVLPILAIPAPPLQTTAAKLIPALSNVTAPVQLPLQLTALLLVQALTTAMTAIPAPQTPVTTRVPVLPIALILFPSAIT